MQIASFNTFSPMYDFLYTKLYICVKLETFITCQPHVPFVQHFPELSTLFVRGLDQVIEFKNDLK